MSEDVLKNIQERDDINELEKCKLMLNEHAKNWIHNQILITRLENPDLKELNFLKSRVDIDGGGIYLFSFIHVSGEKILLTKESNKNE